MREGGQGGCQQVLKSNQAKYMKESDFDLRVSLIIERAGRQRGGGGVGFVSKEGKFLLLGEQDRIKMEGVSFIMR